MNIRRYYIPNSTIFITQVVNHRKPIFEHEQFVTLLLKTLRNVKEIHPFIMVGYVFLFDHFHLMLRPTGTNNFSQIMQSLKRNFTLEYKKQIGLSDPLEFWQKGFWDHVIRNDIDFERHLNYIHYNPVHHGLVEKPEAWQHSSYLRWQARNVYAPRWGWTFPSTIANHNWDPAEDNNDV